MIKRERKTFKRNIRAVVIVYENQGNKDCKVYADCDVQTAVSILQLTGVTILKADEVDLDVRISLADLIKYGDVKLPEEYTDLVTQA